MPIKILILSSHSGMRDILTSYLSQHNLVLDYAATINGLLIRIEENQPHIILVYAEPEAVLNSLEAYTSVFRHPYIPVVIVHHQIAPEIGIKLLDAAFSDYISLFDLTDEALTRSFRLLIQVKAKNAEIIRLKETDLLTEIKNRSCFYRMLENYLANILRCGGALALVSLDIDNFKAFNQNMGYAAGDQVLLDLRDRLLSCADSFPVFRTGDDEFAILITAATTAAAKTEADRLLTALAGVLYRGFDVAGHNNIISTSIGVTFAPGNGMNADSLTNQANQARNRAKRMHGCSFSIYEQSKDKTPSYLGLLEADIWTALKKEQFELYYQPRIDLLSGDIVGAEALIRWNHPEHGLIMPSDFIPVSEHTGQIVPLGFWAILQTGRDLKQIKNAGFSLAKVGVNLSFRQFQDDHLVQTIHRIIEAEQIDTRIFEFELTESALFSDDQHVRKCIEQLSKIGIDFSLDDFGTGYSSFSLLQKLPISSLKIDRSFVAQLPDSHDDAEIVRAIISLAHNLKIGVIAEGVENKAQLEFLIKHECDQVQGYFFSPPVPLPEFMKMLKAD
jgi:diguanylate cyclase (GGDEF)-like protein